MNIGFLDQHSPAVRALMNATNKGSPEDAILERAVRLLEEVAIDKLPVNLGIVASYQRVKSIQRVNMSQAGRLIPVEQDYIIQVNMNHLPSKQNFTIAHEIGHTLLMDYQSAPRMVNDRTTGHYKEKQEEEYLCDLAAAELLMPSSFFWSLTEGKELSFSLVEALSQQFGSSRQATAIRLVHTGLWPCAFVVWDQSYCSSLAPRFMGKRRPRSFAGLGIKYVVYSSTFAHYLPWYLAVQDDGCLAQCFMNGGVVCGEEKFKLWEQDLSLYVMAAAVEYRPFFGQRNREIYCFFLSSSRFLDN